MFGIPDFTVALAYLTLILSALGCVAYGLFFWNRGDEASSEELKQEQSWMKEKLEIDTEISGEELE